jgi:hypothetical protein
MTTKPNTIHDSKLTNNYFEIPDNIEIYRIGISDILVTDTEITFAYNDVEISVSVPTTEELDDYDCLSRAIEKKLMKNDIPYEIIVEFAEYFKLYEEEAIGKIRQIREDAR